MTDQYPNDEMPDAEPMGISEASTNTDRPWIKDEGTYNARIIKIKDLGEQIQLIYHTTDGEWVYQEKFKKSRNELSSLLKGLGVDPITVTPARLKKDDMAITVKRDDGGYLHITKMEWTDGGVPF